MQRKSLREDFIPEATAVLEEASIEEQHTHIIEKNVIKMKNPRIIKIKKRKRRM